MGTTYCGWAGNECPNCKLATKGRLRVKHWWKKVLWHEWSTRGLVEKDYWVYEIKCRECDFRWNVLLCPYCTYTAQWGDNSQTELDNHVTMTHPDRTEYFTNNMRGCNPESHIPLEPNFVSNVNNDPLKILKTRYARGEITKDEFEEMKKDLE